MLKCFGMSEVSSHEERGEGIFIPKHQKVVIVLVLGLPDPIEI